MNAMDNFGTSFSSGNPKGCNNLYLIVDPIYWHAKVGGTEYAYSVETPQNNTPQTISNPPVKGRVKQNRFQWDWGLRVGIGRYFAHDNWDANLSYTWYQTNNTDSVSKGQPAFITPLKFPETARMSAAKSTFDLGYNNVNFQLARHYFLSSKISMKPHIGVKSSWLDLDQNIHYKRTFFNFPSVHEGTTVKTRIKSIMWGIGPRSGANMEWYVGDGFSLAGNVAGSLLYSYIRGKVHSKADANSSILGSIVNREIKNKFHAFVPHIQMFLGLIWEKFLFKGTKHITLGAGYEAEYFWRANCSYEIEDTHNLNIQASRRDQIQKIAEDVMFYGLTLKARLDF